MRQILAVIGWCVLLLLVLRLATVGADSATSIVRADGRLVRLPSPTPSPAEECASFAQFWMDVSGRGPDDVAAVSHCRRDASGAWVLAQDIPEPSLPDTTRAATIKAQLAGLESTLPAKLRHALADIYDPVAKPGTGHVRQDPGVAEINARYAQELWAYLQDPAHRDLADYAAWLTARRDAAVAAFSHGCKTYPRMRETCDRLARTVGPGRAPWPWDLDDDLLLAEYLARSQEESAPSPSS
jgi:hypothetical protein